LNVDLGEKSWRSPLGRIPWGEAGITPLAGWLAGALRTLILTFRVASFFPFRNLEKILNLNWKLQLVLG
jgi:hypothetical protein